MACDTDRSVLYEDRLVRSSDDPPRWWTCCWGAHPLGLLVCTPTCLYVCRLVLNENRRGTEVVRHLGYQQIKGGSYFRGVQRHPRERFIGVLLTDAHLVLFDERLLPQVLVQWDLCLPSWCTPSMASFCCDVLRTSGDDDDSSSMMAERSTIESVVVGCVSGGQVRMFQYTRRKPGGGIFPVRLPYPLPTSHLVRRGQDEGGDAQRKPTLHWRSSLRLPRCFGLVGLVWPKPHVVMDIGLGGGHSTPESDQLCSSFVLLNIDESGDVFKTCFGMLDARAVKDDVPWLQGRWECGLTLPSACALFGSLESLLPLVKRSGSGNAGVVLDDALDVFDGHRRSHVHVDYSQFVEKIVRNVRVGDSDVSVVRDSRDGMRMVRGVWGGADDALGHASDQVASSPSSAVSSDVYASALHRIPSVQDVVAGVMNERSGRGSSERSRRGSSEWTGPDSYDGSTYSNHSTYHTEGSAGGSRSQSRGEESSAGDGAGISQSLSQLFVDVDTITLDSPATTEASVVPATRMDSQESPMPKHDEQRETSYQSAQRKEREERALPRDDRETLWLHRYFQRAQSDYTQAFPLLLADWESALEKRMGNPSESESSVRKTPKKSTGGGVPRVSPRGPSSATPRVTTASERRRKRRTRMSLSGAHRRAAQRRRSAASMGFGGTPSRARPGASASHQEDQAPSTPMVARTPSASSAMSAVPGTPMGPLYGRVFGSSGGASSTSGGASSGQSTPANLSFSDFLTGSPSIPPSSPPVPPMSTTQVSAASPSATTTNAAANQGTPRVLRASARRRSLERRRGRKRMSRSGEQRRRSQGF